MLLIGNNDRESRLQRQSVQTPWFSLSHFKIKGHILKLDTIIIHNYLKTTFDTINKSRIFVVARNFIFLSRSFEAI